jgi:tripartite-type tricarboxylate transporter receptor subunit TctC
MKLQSWRRLIVAVLAAMTMGAPLSAQNYPARPMTLVVPFAAGGPNDIMSRIVAEHMSRTLGQPVVIENVAGAGGTTGSTRVAASAPDGYTLLSGHVGTHAAAPALYANLRYNPLADFTPVGLVAETPILLATKRDLQAETLQAFAGLARQRGGEMTVGHAGVGSIGHISCLLLAGAIGFKPAEVPYRGSAQAMTDLIAGQYDFTCALLVDVLPFTGSDRLKFLTVSAPARVPQLPSTPTATEAGLPEFKASSWFAFYLPKGVPDAIRDRLVSALKAALDDPTVRNKLETAGLTLPEPDQRGPEPLKLRMSEEAVRWLDVVRKAKIRLDP